MIFGSLNAAGVRLNGLTGIAAILRFELPQLQDMVDEDEGDLDSDEEGEMGFDQSDSEEEKSQSSSQKKSKKEKDDKEETKSGQAHSEVSENPDKDFLDGIFMDYGQEFE